jgi:hypothetical protein
VVSPEVGFNGELLELSVAGAGAEAPAAAGAAAISDGVCALGGCVEVSAWLAVSIAFNGGGESTSEADGEVAEASCDGRESGSPPPPKTQ